MTASFDAVIFDFDGTLMASEELWFEVCADMYRSHGAVLDPGPYRACVGGSLEHFDPYGDLAVLLGDPSLRKTLCRGAVEEYRRRSLLLPPKAGVAEALAVCGEAGLKVGLASGSCRDDVVPHLERWGVLARFKVLCCLDDGHRPKPAPDLYLAALEGLEVSASRALAVEDSVHGVRAAEAAGMPWVQIPHWLSDPVPGGHILPSLKGLGAFPGILP